LRVCLSILGNVTDEIWWILIWLLVYTWWLSGWQRFNYSQWHWRKRVFSPLKLRKSTGMRTGLLAFSAIREYILIKLFRNLYGFKLKFWYFFWTILDC